MCTNRTHPRPFQPWLRLAPPLPRLSPQVPRPAGLARPPGPPERPLDRGAWSPVPPLLRLSSLLGRGSKGY
eukprot:9467959-Pyramimonas_sp.AAC.3